MPRVWITGYGTRALTLAGRIADGVILQFANPALISMVFGISARGGSPGRPRFREARENVGRGGLDFGRFKCPGGSPRQASTHGGSGS
jgi:alkanesulfonate monooxygenase SsuD/methylene tetrahydromethanopterin reductase-like flavin-dependent oxidoreductase (luciferase family)